MDPTAIVIPGDLLPSDGRFGSGPSLVPDAAVEALAADARTYLGTSHRRLGVRSVVAEIRAGLSELYGIGDGHEVALGVGGATAFWDAASFQLIERRSQHLVFGEFSERFAATVAVAPHLEPPDLRSADPGAAPEADPTADVDAFATVHNETSTGVMPPLARPGREGALFLVDATSAAGAVEIDPDAVDAYYFSPQKAFAADGGLWLALLSPAAVERITRLAESRPTPPSVSLAVALANSRLDQTYNTPALATLHLVRTQLRWMLANGGLAWCAERCRTSSAAVYAWAERVDHASPFVQDPALRSTTTATVDLAREIPLGALCDVLRSNGIVDVEGYRKLGRNQLRIATFPARAPDDVERLTAAIDYVVERL